MLRFSLLLVTLLGAAMPSFAAISFVEDFNAPLDPVWTTTDTSESAALTQANSRYEFTGVTGNAGERSRVTVDVPYSLSLSNDWTIAVDMHMDALSSFGSEVEFSGGLLLNTLQLNALGNNGDEHRIEFNLAMLDSSAFGGSGVTSGYRFAEQFRPNQGDNTDVINEIEFTQTNTAQDIVAYFSYDSNAQQIVAGLDTGTGLVQFSGQTVDTSTWSIASGAFDVFLESQVGYVADQATGPQNLAVTTGEMYFDNLTIWDEELAIPVPEPSSFALLGGLCALGFVAARRRV